MILSGLLTWAVTIISLSAAAMMLFVAMGFEWMLQAGDVVEISPGVEHWHGATPESDFCHVTVQRGGATDWDVERKDFDEGYGA